MKPWISVPSLATLAAVSCAAPGTAGDLVEPQCAALEEWSATVNPKDRYTPLPGNNAWAPKAFGTPEFAALFGKPALALTKDEIAALSAHMRACQKTATREKRYAAQKSLNAARGMLVGRLARIVTAKQGMAAAAAGQEAAESRYRAQKDAMAAERARQQEKAVHDYLARLLGQPDSPELLHDLALLRTEPMPAAEALSTPFGRNFPDYISHSGLTPQDPEIAAPIDTRIAELRGRLVADAVARIAAVPSSAEGLAELGRIESQALFVMGPGLRETDRRRISARADKRRAEIRADMTHLAEANIAALPASLDGLATLASWRQGIATLDVTAEQRAALADAIADRQAEIAEAVLARTQAALAGLPGTPEGLARFDAALSAAAPALAVARQPVREGFSRAAADRQAKLRRDALPEFRTRLAALPETRDGRRAAERQIAFAEAMAAGSPLREAYLAAATDRRDAINLALDKQDSARRAAALAAGGDPRLVGLSFREPTAGMTLEFRDDKLVMLNILGMRAPGDYQVSDDDVVVHGPHGALVLHIDGNTLSGMGLNFAREDG